MLTEKMDENGATTTYNYSSTNNAYCNWAFPTSATEPPNMSHSMTWNCTGGVMTQLKDETVGLNAETKKSVDLRQPSKKSPSR
jgi:hypothetical protein